MTSVFIFMSIPPFLHFVFQVCHKSLYKHAPFHLSQLLHLHHRAVFVKPLFLLKLSFETLHCTLWNGHAKPPVLVKGLSTRESLLTAQSFVSYFLMFHIDFSGTDFTFTFFQKNDSQHLQRCKCAKFNIYKNVNVRQFFFGKM